MIRYFCDKCGQELIGQYSKLAMLDQGDPWKADRKTYYSLCPKCRVEFAAWIGLEDRKKDG